jgi:hypothetical protein
VGRTEAETTEFETRKGDERKRKQGERDKEKETRNERQLGIRDEWGISEGDEKKTRKEIKRVQNRNGG